MFFKKKKKNKIVRIPVNPTFDDYNVSYDDDDEEEEKIFWINYYDELEEEEKEREREEREAYQDYLYGDDDDRY